MPSFNFLVVLVLSEFRWDRGHANLDEMKTSVLFTGFNATELGTAAFIYILAIFYFLQTSLGQAGISTNFFTWPEYNMFQIVNQGLFVPDVCFQSFFNYVDMRALLKNFCVYHVNAPGQEEGAPTLPEEWVLIHYLYLIHLFSSVYSHCIR